MHCGIKQSCCGFVSIVMKQIFLLVWYHRDQTLQQQQHFPTPCAASVCDSWEELCLECRCFPWRGCWIWALSALFQLLSGLWGKERLEERLRGEVMEISAGYRRDGEADCSVEVFD